MPRPIPSGALDPGRYDVRSPVYGIVGGALFVIAGKLVLDAGGAFWAAFKTIKVIDDRIEAFIVATFFVLLAGLGLLYGYRFLRMIDRTWRREYLRLRAPRVRETRHTLHLVRKSPLTLGGIVIIALFILIAALASVAPALVVPSPADGGAVLYRGEFFWPPFERTQVWRNETIVETLRNDGWYGWTDDEDAPIGPPNPRRLGGDAFEWTRQAEPPRLSTDFARSDRHGEAFVATDFRLDDVYRDTIGFVGVQIRQQTVPGNYLAVSVSWDVGRSWSLPLTTTDGSYGGSVWGETLEFTSAVPWSPARVRPGVLLVHVVHVTAPGFAEGPVKIDYFAVRLFFEGRYVLLGTDELGRDYLSRIILAAPLDLLIAIVVVVSALLIGVVLGVVSGYYGGWVDEVIMRVTDIFLSIPGLILALAFTAALGPGLLNVMTALVITWWPGYTRLIRSQTLTIRESLYIEAARAVGVPSRRIVFRHILPNSFAPVLVNATLDMGTVILVAAALSFLGLGVQPPAPEWGSMVSEGRLYIIAQGLWWLSTFPGLAILFASLGFNLAGDGLRDILDPRMRR